MAAIVAATGVAHAEPTRKVQIESEPPGAAVYLNDVDSGPVCEATPCTFNAPIGVSTIIIRLDKYEPEISELDVPKGKRPLQQRFRLKGAVGTIVVDSPKGATVRIDEVEKGRVPVRIDVSAEAHHVVVAHNGKNVFDDIIEIATGDEFTVKPKMAGSADDDSTTIIDDDEETSGGGGGGGGDSSSKITGRTSPSPRPVYIAAAAAFDIGFRHFKYDDPQTNNLREETEGGQVIGGPAIELWPGRMAGVHALRGLSLYGRLQFPVVGQSFADMGDLMGTVTAKWSSFEASLRHRWVFTSIGVEVGGGFVQDRFTFDATVGNDINLMPDTKYQSVRLGGKLSYLAGPAEVYITGENRIVMSGGPVGERFADSAVTGIRASVGLLLTLGSITARAEGTVMNYNWTFAYQPTDPSRAQGATDSIQLISMALGYNY